MRPVAVLSLLTILTCPSPAQNVPTSDPQALSLAAQSIAAMTGKTSVSDITLNATVTSIAGSDALTGTAILQAKGTAESRVDIKLTGTARTEIRTALFGIPKGAWVKGTAATFATLPLQSYAQHNCWTDAAWFFPVLTSLSQTLNPTLVFSYLGQEQHADVSTYHIRVFQLFPQAAKELQPLQRVTTRDYYLDPTSLLPLAIAFNVHPDDDMNTNIPMEIRFAKYQLVNGVQVPMHIQRLLNGDISLDIVVTSAILNSGLSDIPFTVQ